MDYNKVLAELENASLFDLWRLQSAINTSLDDPKRLEEIKSCLRPGLEVRYFDRIENRELDATIISVKRTRCLLENKIDARRYSVSLCMINLNGVDTKIKRDNKTGLLDRNSLKVGDRVGWYSRRTSSECYGLVVKLNPKRAQVSTLEGMIWRVPYAMLFDIVDAGARADSRVIEGIITKPAQMTLEL
jgi:hypothetical protein